MGGHKNAAKEKDAEELEESSIDNEESVGCKRWWMKEFSRMKVGPPKGVNTVAG